VNTHQTAALADTVMNLYETVRARFVGAPCGPVGELGLAVLIRHGMLAWCHACTPTLDHAPVRLEVVDATRVSVDCHDELIDVMVTMAMTSSVFNASRRGAFAQ
jgi:hypothetical protein